MRIYGHALVFGHVDWSVISPDSKGYVEVECTRRLQQGRRVELPQDSIKR